ncbi:alpha/beta hydrolase [Pseudosulfitobacter pseudonitzschiae]|uniref:alpha/beta hydrolase n=1 Tax=Pseudosulfitobacter pseudonitzschiae TaxID=1402135 RepID=UPI001CD77AA0|nr:alpha/beta hydrolase-fold protein [Pseudosulfitobacter pseudonitzschiae]
MMRDVVAQGMADSGGTRWFDLKDSQTGDIRRVFLWVPPGEAPADGWPALWLLDGNAVIGTAVDVMRAQAFWPTGTNLGWGVLIAVGYPTDAAYDSFRRSWDLGPPPGQSYPPFAADGPRVRTGGGAEMARFLLEDVRGFLAGQVALDPARQSLFGHSFGGLFALWLMFTRPDAFANWIAASPAITWEDSFLLQHLDRFDAGSHPAAGASFSGGNGRAMRWHRFRPADPKLPRGARKRPGPAPSPPRRRWRRPCRRAGLRPGSKSIPTRRICRCCRWR